MNTEKYFDIRFLAPVGIIALFVFLFSPQNLTTLTVSDNWVVNTIGLLSIGFIVSSLTDFIVKIFKLNPKPFDFKDEDLRALSHEQPELAVWIVLGKEMGKSGEQVTTQIHKRWSMAMANFNSAIGVFFGVLIAMALPLWNTGFQYPSYSWFTFYISVALVLFSIFMYNGCEARSSVLGMNRALARRNEQD